MGGTSSRAPELASLMQARERCLKKWSSSCRGTCGRKTKASWMAKEEAKMVVAKEADLAIGHAQAAAPMYSLRRTLASNAEKESQVEIRCSQRWRILRLMKQKETMETKLVRDVRDFR